MLELIGHYIIQLIQTTSYGGIFGLMFLESCLIPIPSEVTMSFAGYLVQAGKLNFIAVVLDGTIANLVGSLAAYYVGYLLEETVLLNLIKKYGKFILVTESDYHHAEHWFKKYGDKIVFISRLLPGIRTVISLPAGMFEMDLKKFIIYTTVGCLLWSAFLTWIGMVLGANWSSIDVYYRKFELLVIALVVIAVLWYIDHKLKISKKFLKKK